MLCQPEESVASVTDVTHSTRLDRVLPEVTERSSLAMAVRQNSGVSVRGDKLRCFYCQAFGHIARNCRKSRHFFPQNSSIALFVSFAEKLDTFRGHAL